MRTTENDFLTDCVSEADRAELQFGPHPSVEFAACRIAEEAGELVQAMTSVSRDRAGWGVEHRRDMARKEAVQAVAMILRGLREL